MFIFLHLTLSNLYNFLHEMKFNKKDNKNQNLVEDVSMKYAV